MPGLSGTPPVTCGWPKTTSNRGRSPNAAASLAQLEEAYPRFSIAVYRKEAAFWQPTEDFVDRAVAALRKAGLQEGEPGT